jgi:hypothetical protein
VANSSSRDPTGLFRFTSLTAFGLYTPVISICFWLMPLMESPLALVIHYFA